MDRTAPPGHAETACPEWSRPGTSSTTDLRNAAPDGARRPATRKPPSEILARRVLAADPAGEADRARLGETGAQCGAELLAVAAPYPGGRQALRRCRERLGS